ncbi:hypothetical protein GJ496_011254 [Pomphorhynchus laevis]|nr:hypothetical protein GJ496_011254 [Pomphorhynchus laevis]
MINNSNSSFASPNNPLLANANTSSSKQANQATEKFINRYYKIMDELRHSLVKLYHKDATLVWNGNEVTGADKIHDYYRMFPSSWHII